MKSLTKLMAMGLLSVGLAACSSDDEVLPQGGQSFNDGDKVYMSLNLDFPVSRTATGETTTEEGTASENKVSNAVILLKKADGTYVESQTVYGDGKLYTAVFQSAQMQNLASTSVGVYVLCNGTNEALAQGAEKSIYAVDNTAPANQYVQSTAWKTNQFLMSNAEEAKSVTLPSAADMLAKHSTKEHPINLGTVPVERLAARFDYAPAVDGNLYHMVEGESPATKEYVNVQLEEIGMINYSKNEYYFRRVNDGKQGVATLGGAELVSNYVVDTDWSKKALVNTATATSFYYPSADFTTNKNNAAYGVMGKGSIGTYVPFTYASENTLPYIDKSENLNVGDMTTVVFKGVLAAGTNASEEMNQLLSGQTKTDEGLHPYVVCFQNKIYGTWEMAKTYATAPENADNAEAQSLENAIAAVEAHAKDNGGEIDYQWAVQKFGFKFFTWNTEKDHGYEVYYLYYNKHNDLGKEPSHKFDPMRYGVVRNNVYKLKVNKIAKYGHPFDNNLDPDPYDPGVDPEPTSAYFEIGVQVLPWTVRVNDIEF